MSVSPDNARHGRMQLLSLTTCLDDPACRCEARALCSAHSQVLRSYTYVVIWMSISISVILFNKWLLAFSGFPYPIALTSWHMLFCSTVGFLCVRVFKVVKSHNMTAHTYTRRVLPIGAFDNVHLGMPLP